MFLLSSQEAADARRYADMDSDVESQDLRPAGVAGFFQGTTPTHYRQEKRSKVGGPEWLLSCCPRLRVTFT